MQPEEQPLCDSRVLAPHSGRDTRLDRIVAIKVSQAQFSERFKREARAGVAGAGFRIAKSPTSSLCEHEQ